MKPNAIETPKQSLKVGDIVIYDCPHTIHPRQYVVTHIRPDGLVGTMVERTPEERCFTEDEVKKIVE